MNDDPTVSPPILTARDLRKSYPLRRDVFGRLTGVFDAVSGVSLDIAKGSTVGVVGESGAGKSTVGRMVLRLIEPDSGHVTFDGVDLLALGRTELRRMRRRMQMIFQDPFSSLDPRLVIEDAVAEPVRLHANLDAAACRRRVYELLDRVGITAANASRYPHEFSGGQLQRIAIARALATEPDIIVCDEPVAALDVSVRAQVINLLQDLQEERGVAYIFISHDLSLVRHIADHVVVMRSGVVVEEGHPENLFAAPVESYTRQLLDAIPVADPDRRRAHRERRREQVRAAS